jgi:hypothetical protein
LPEASAISAKSKQKWLALYLPNVTRRGDIMKLFFKSKLIIFSAIAFLVSHQAEATFRFTVTATGQTQAINASGDDGDDGSDGSDGSSPFCHFDDKNDGGDGQNGEDGKDGDDGDDVLIQFENISHLSKLHIDASGGRGGKGGHGGDGGQGCGGGLNGSDGSDGSDGSSGDSGQIYLYNSLSTFTPDMTSISTTAKELMQAPVVLTRNIWKSVSGANQLLAPGSYVSDRYNVFQSRVQKTIRVDWSSRKSPAGLGVGISLSNDNSTVNYNYYGLVIGSATPTNDGLLLKISEYFTPSELFAMQVVALKQQKRDFIRVADVAVLDHGIKTKVQLTVYKKHTPLFGSSWVELKETMDIPTAYVTNDGHLAFINIEAMKKAELKKYAEASKSHYVNVKVTRTYENQARMKEFEVNLKL